MTDLHKGAVLQVHRSDGLSRSAPDLQLALLHEPAVRDPGAVGFRRLLGSAR